MTTYYLSPSGNDSNAGTSSGAAWRTLSKANATVSPGDTVRLLAGTYDRVTWTTPGTSGNVITIMADDINDKPQILTDYHAIADSATGSNSAGDAAIYINNADYLTIQGILIDNERAPGIFARYENKNAYSLTIDQCVLNAVVPVTNLSGTAGQTSKTMSPIWIIHKGNGTKLYNLRCADLTFTNCSARTGPNTSGGGTEILTLKGALDGVLVEGCYFDGNVGINLNSLGVDSLAESEGALGQPKNVVFRNNTFIGTTRINYGSASTVQAIYTDRGDGPIEMYGNLIYCNDTMAMLQNSFEPERLTNMNPPRKFAIHDNVIVSGFIAGQSGSDRETNTYEVQDIRFAHNVFVAAQSQWSGFVFRMRKTSRLGLTNNVFAQYGGGQVIGSHITATAARIATCFAKGNIVWKNADDSSVVWGNGNNMTRSTFNSSIQGGTGGTGKPVFAHGLTNIAANTDLTALTLADWTLAADSPGYKAAEPLTYAEGAGTATDEIVVDDPYYFGPGIPALGVAGTAIMIGESEAVITAIDYDDRTLTLDRNVTWSDDAEIRYKPVTAGVYSVGITSAASEDVTPEDPGDPTTNTNMLANGGFDEGTTGWLFHRGTGSGNFSVADGEAIVNVPDASATTQFYQYSIPIVSGTEYELTLWAKSDRTAQTVTCKVIKHGSPYTNLGLNSNIEVLQSCSKHTLTFTATGSDTNARLQFLIIDDGTINIRGIYLGPAGGAVGSCTDTPEPGPPPAGADPVTQNLQVAASLDDWGDNSLSFFGTTDTVLSPGGDKNSSAYDYRLLARFQLTNTIGQDWAVDEVTTEIYSTSQDSGAGLPDVRVRAVASTNTSRPADATASKALGLTTAYVDYSFLDTTREWKTIVGLEAIIEELLALGELTAGNYITLVYGPQTTGWGGSNTMQYVRTYDYAGNAHGPKLNITATPPLAAAATNEHQYGETFSETFSETFAR